MCNQHEIKAVNHTNTIDSAKNLNESQLHLNRYGNIIFGKNFHLNRYGNIIFGKNFEKFLCELD